MTIRNVILWTVFAVVAAGLSIPLALLSEALAVQHAFLEGTPGLFVAIRLAPPNSIHAFEIMGRQMTIALAIDAPCWFLIICGTAVLVSRRRRRDKAQGRQRDRIP